MIISKHLIFLIARNQVLVLRYRFFPSTIFNLSSVFFTFLHPPSSQAKMWSLVSQHGSPFDLLDELQQGSPTPFPRQPRRNRQAPATMIDPTQAKQRTARGSSSLNPRQFRTLPLIRTSHTCFQSSDADYGRGATSCQLLPKGKSKTHIGPPILLHRSSDCLKRSI